MVLKSYAKINLSLKINRKLSNGLHDLQTIFCSINIFDKIFLKKLSNAKKDKITFKGPYSKYIKDKNNTVEKVLNIMRRNKLISNFYSVKIFKKIPVFAGLGGGTSNASTILKYLTKKKIKKKTLEEIIRSVGTDLRLFFYDQGYLKNLESEVKFAKKHKLNFLLVYPNFRCSTKKVYSKVKKYSKKKQFNQRNFNTKKKFINFIKGLDNDLQSIVEKQFPIFSNLLVDISNSSGCNFSRMTGSGSVCYGLFKNENSSKAALKKLRKKYPKFWFSIAKTI